MSSTRRSKRKFSQAVATPLDDSRLAVGAPETPALPPGPRCPEAVGVALIFAIALLLLAAIFSDRRGAVDEIGLFNPAYMDLHYGKISYPIYGYFDNMVVHPPVHYKILAAIMRRGLSYYYAEATPAFLLLLAAALLVAVSGFPGPVKIGLLFGLVAPIAVFATEELELFGVRPESHLNAAWLAGLIALESGRFKNWDWKRLLAGAFLLTYASGLHYYAAPAMLGVVVYMVWAVVQLGWRRGSKPLLAMIVGGVVFGVPYLTLFLIPDWRPVMEMLRSIPPETVRQTLQHHIDLYHDLAAQHDGGLGMGLWFRIGLPVVLLSTPILIAIRSTRSLALAALPLQVFILLFAGHKHAYYLLHEVSLYCAAVVAGGAILVDRLSRKFSHSPILPRAAVTAVALLVGVSLLSAKWNMGRSKITLEPRMQEADIARAAGKAMLGPNARVGSRLGPWYASGAAHWYNISFELLWTKLPVDFDVAQYVSMFDAVAENDHMSYSAQNGRNATLSSWYADGTLKLGGFFFSDSNEELSYLLLRGTPASTITGYALKHGQLVRFDEKTTGDYELLSLACPTASRWDFRSLVRYSGALQLPGAHLNETDQVLLTALVPADGPRNYATLHPACRVVQRIAGSVSPVDLTAFVDKMRREDQPMRFYQKRSDMPGMASAGQ